VGGVTYARTHAFAAGARRGIDVAAAPGARVGAACGGRVTFAGRVPSGGRGVSVRCGGLVATHLGLGRLAVRRGAVVAPGSRLGELGAGGRLRLGAREAADRLAYVDPAALLGDEPGRGPARVPLGRAPRAPAVPAARPAPARVPVRAADRAPRVPRAAPARIPALAWAGLVALAAGLPLGGLVRRDRRRRARRAAAAVPATASPGRSRL
jgi:murein DD-endopeptidase MepM/ murein hydrolase activator NlpD